MCYDGIVVLWCEAGGLVCPGGPKPRPHTDQAWSTETHPGSQQPNKHDTFTQWWFNVGPASQTVVQL